MSFATKEATFAYLKQFPKYAKDFYRFNGDFFISSLGLGTFRKEPYREENYIVNYKDSVKMAVLNGINLIDTAINYRYQVSEEEIGEALEELFEEGKASRDQLIITSKAGFLPLEFPFPENPYKWITENVIESGLATKEEIIIDQHCLSPKYLRWSVEKSLKNLKLKTLDILFLHNPETQLGYVDYDTLLKRIEKSFKLFEKLVQEGKIKSYGIATWNGFLYEDTHKEYICLGDIVKIAQKVGGKNHNFKYVQSPFNLGKPEAYNFTNQKGPDGRYYTLLQAVNGYGLQLMASSSLLQLNLFKGKFSSRIGAEMGTSDFNDVTSALQFARSGGVVSALFGAVDPNHVEENLTLAYLPSASKNNMDAVIGKINAL
ncbi:MAG: aryl-alcohol dehydrogenase-like predicted oxidoreductase [Sulfurimonas sp.]|jgi:aryl-alcohol dehydrogenase-like predicted oxidoreductase|uniref:aldo/keto reductase n=1 Tax=Sulfurimonas sp. TaxID=2022749 RepID=UPI0039E32CB7